MSYAGVVGSPIRLKWSTPKWRMQSAGIGIELFLQVLHNFSGYWGMERTAACQLGFSIDFAFHFGESATARTRALSRAIHQCDNAVFRTWWNVVVAATGCLIKLKRNGQIANCRLKGIWNSFVSATGCMPIIGHLVAPPSTLSGPWHSTRSSNSNNAASPSSASFASIIGIKKLHKALWQYVGYIKISHSHAHTHTRTLTYSLSEREWSEQSKRCVIDHKTEKKMRIKQAEKKAAVAGDASQWTDWQRTDESPSTIARLRPRWSHQHDEPLRPLGHTPIGPAWGHWAIALGVHGQLPSLQMIQLDFGLAKSWLETALSAFQLSLAFSCCPYANDLRSAYADLSMVRVRSVSNGIASQKGN